MHKCEKTKRRRVFLKLFSLHKALQVRREKETKRLTVSVKTIARVHVGVLDHVSAPDYVAITQAVINLISNSLAATSSPFESKTLIC